VVARRHYEMKDGAVRMLPVTLTAGARRTLARRHRVVVRGIFVGTPANRLLRITLTRPRAATRSAAPHA
jgi:hypothetical protein